MVKEGHCILNFHHLSLQEKGGATIKVAIAKHSIKVGGLQGVVQLWQGAESNLEVIIILHGNGFSVA